MIRLKRVGFDDKEKVLAYRAAFHAEPENLHGTAGLIHYASFEEWFDNVHRNSSVETVADGLVVSSTFLALDETNNVVGFIDVRHDLNDALKQIGGHIGYSVAPQERHKGYAKQMLQLALQFIKEIGVHEVLVTCNQDNLASKKTIEANHGKLQDVIDGTCRYFIHV